MATFNAGDSVARNMTIRVGGVLTNADPALTATLYVNGVVSAEVVTIGNVAIGEYLFTYTVPGALTNNAVLAIKVVGAVGGVGFTEWLEDQYSDSIGGVTLDYSCIADWVLRQPVSAAETSVCTGVPDASPNSLLYLVKNLAPNSAWFATIINQTATNNCNCGSITCSSCNSCCY